MTAVPVAGATAGVADRDDDGDMHDSSEELRGGDGPGASRWPTSDKASSLRVHTEMVGCRGRYQSAPRIPHRPDPRRRAVTRAVHVNGRRAHRRSAAPRTG